MNAAQQNDSHEILSFDESSDQRLAAFLKLATRLEWQILSYDHIGIQLRQQKRYGAGFYFAGALTAVIGIGFLIWIVGWIDYAFKRDRLLYIPRKDLMQDRVSTTADLLL